MHTEIMCLFMMSYLGTVASLNQQHSAKVDLMGPPNEVVISCLS